MRPPRMFTSGLFRSLACAILLMQIGSSKTNLHRWRTESRIRRRDFIEKLRPECFGHKKLFQGERIRMRWSRIVLNRLAGKTTQSRFYKWRSDIAKHQCAIVL